MRIWIRPDRFGRRVAPWIPAGIALAPVVPLLGYSGWRWALLYVVLFWVALLLRAPAGRPGRIRWDWLGIDSGGTAWVATGAGLAHEQRERIRVSGETRVFRSAVLLVFRCESRKGLHLLWLSTGNIDREDLRRLRMRLRWPVTLADKPAWRTRLLEGHARVAGILRGRAGEGGPRMTMLESMPQVDHLLNEDPDHVYSDEELDAIEAVDPELALRIDRAQTFARRADTAAPHDGPIDEDAVRAAIEEARRILSQDGGDLEYIGLRDRIVQVRLKGACVGCPRSTLDLRNVVERLVKARAPGVRSVSNQF